MQSRGLLSLFGPSRRAMSALLGGWAVAAAVLSSILLFSAVAGARPSDERVETRTGFASPEAEQLSPFGAPEPPTPPPATAPTTPKEGPQAAHGKPVTDWVSVPYEETAEGIAERRRGPMGWAPVFDVALFGGFGLGTARLEGFFVMTGLRAMISPIPNLAVGLQGGVFASGLPDGAGAGGQTLSAPILGRLRASNDTVLFASVGPGFAHVAGSERSARNPFDTTAFLVDASVGATKSARLGPVWLAFTGELKASVVAGYGVGIAPAMSWHVGF
jgi:hypothetical protein